MTRFSTGWQCAQHSKGELKMEWHKDSLFQKRTERERAGERQGQEKNGTARGSKLIKNNFPTLSKKEKNEGEKDEDGSGAPAPAGSWWYPAFVSNESRSLRAPIIQLIWGNSSMLCKRLSVAMVRNPWRPPPTQHPSSPPCPPPHPLYKALAQELSSAKANRRGGGGLE